MTRGECKEDKRHDTPGHVTKSQEDSVSKDGPVALPYA
jgi:hypothetical protein